jgi:SAM-dependent methyltransferase
MNGNIPKPYDASAQYSDYVYEKCFGAAGQRLNDEVVRVVKKLLLQPSRILEAGAGTGRLTIPLAEAGHTVTTVDQSPGMLARLERKLALLPLETRARVAVRPPVRIERYRLREQRYDLVLCVFTILNHLLKAADLKAFAQSAFRRLKPGGLLLFGMATEPVLVSGITPGPLARTGTFNLDGLRRHLQVQQTDGDAYTVTDTCWGTIQESPFRYRDTYALRLWRPEVVMEVLRSAGLVRVTDDSDVSSLARIDAECFLFRKPKRGHEDDDGGIEFKVVAGIIPMDDPAVEIEPEIQMQVVTLPELQLQDIISLLRLTGFWLRRSFKGDFAESLPNLARCRVLVQCNPEQTRDGVHDRMARLPGWDFSGVRVKAVYHAPITGTDILDGHQLMRSDEGAAQPFLEGFRSAFHKLVGDATGVTPENCWIDLYRIVVSFDNQNERLLRVLQIGWPTLATLTFFLEPNRLLPDRLV